MPGLVNGHTHAAMTLFRGYSDDLPLMRWLEERIWPVEARLDAEDVYWAARLACLEMVRTGTVRFWDMYWQPDATARAVEDAGLRATIGAPLIDIGAAGRGLLERDALESLDALEGRERDRPCACAALDLHGLERSLEWIAEQAAESELPVHIHLSETESEVNDCVRDHGLRPAAYLDSLGVLGPRTLLAHGVWLDDSERELIAEHGCTLVTNPVANLKLAVGRVFDSGPLASAAYPSASEPTAPARTTRSTCSSDVKFLALLQKHEARDAAAVTAAEAWEVATGGAAPLLGASGRLTQGEPADFLLVRADSPELSLGDLTADLVYAASGAVVDTTVVAGRVLMRGGIVEAGDEVRERAVERARRLGIV